MLVLNRDAQDAGWSGGMGMLMLRMMLNRDASI